MPDTTPILPVDLHEGQRIWDPNRDVGEIVIIDNQAVMVTFDSWSGGHNGPGLVHYRKGSCWWIPRTTALLWAQRHYTKEK
jgi:hypothetical protein